MDSLCQGCAYLIRLSDDEFECAKPRCVVPVNRVGKPTPAPSPVVRPWASLVLTPEQAGWSKRRGDLVYYHGDNKTLVGRSFKQKNNDVVVLNGVEYISLEKALGELIPMKYCS